MQFLKNRLPARQDVRAVFSVAVLAVFSWEIRQFLFKLPSFLYYSTPADLFSILAYMLGLALLESTLLTGALILPAMILPARWYRKGFAYKGFLTILIGTLSSIQFQKDLPTHFPAMPVLYDQIGVTAVLIAASILLAHNLVRLQKVLLSIVDSVSIMSFIYVPLGLVSLLVVAIRNLF